MWWSNQSPRLRSAASSWERTPAESPARAAIRARTQAAYATARASPSRSPSRSAAASATSASAVAADIRQRLAVEVEDDSAEPSARGKHCGRPFEARDCLVGAAAGALYTS